MAGKEAPQPESNDQAPARKFTWAKSNGAEPTNEVDRILGSWEYAFSMAHGCSAQAPRQLINTVDAELGAARAVQRGEKTVAQQFEEITKTPPPPSPEDKRA